MNSKDSKELDLSKITAFILCGGKGTRLRPYTYTVPKPMLKIGSRPLLEYVIRNLKRCGINNYVFTVGYLKQQIMNYFEDGSKFGVNIEYLIEDEDKPKNTAGSIVDGKNKVDKNYPFVVMMGDHLTDINIRDMINFHLKNRGIATLAIKVQGIPLEYGIVEIDDKEKVIKEFKEKPVLSQLINMGIYVCDHKIFDYIKEGDDFASHVFPRLLKEKHKLNAYLFDGYWEDIGRITDYERVHQLISLIDFIKDF
ncbi:MAG: nucleotidyltransferase family protein [Candidatus Micrarchaeota archaeon]|nr:nucleotidyltransferase family protein [Candidatus Micrarchaeota archaeon]